MGTVQVSSELAIIVVLVIVGLLQLWTIALTRKNGHGVQDIVEEVLGRWSDTLRKRAERVEKANGQFNDKEVEQLINDSAFQESMKRLAAKWQPPK